MSELVDRLRATAGGYLGPIHPTLNELEAADEIERLRALLAEARAALAPFAALKPSSFFSPDGSEAERYHIVLAVPAKSPIEGFTGDDLARARNFMEKSAGDEDGYMEHAACGASCPVRIGPQLEAWNCRTSPWHRIDDPENKFPWHKDVLLFREDTGVFMGRYSHVADWLIDPECAEADKYDEETLFAMDWWAYCENGCERLYSDMPPTHWMPVPDGPELEGAFAEENTARRRAAVQTIRDEAQRLGLEE